ncbi:MAG: FGGY family carbohydrate kinase [Negativicutes bacterium]|nr:FGGY family carbohydrate kinase [Negativicutes bacterium]
MEHVLVVDVGTSSLKTMLYSKTGQLLYRSGKEYHSEFGRDNHVEQNPASWKDALQVTLKAAGEFIKEKNIHIDAIAVTSQRASVIPVDRDGNPLHNAIMWQDKRSVAQCGKLLAQMNLKDIYRRTGLRVDPYFSAPKMMWLQDERPELYAKTHKMLGVQDYVVYLLTGSFVTDWTQACRTMLMNINSFSWDEDLLRIAGISPSLLADLRPPGSIVGYLDNKLAAAARLAPGTPVVIGGGDQQCAALALNILRTGYAEANTGTGSFVIAYSEKPQFDDNCRTLCSAAAVPGKWIAEAGIFNTGSIHRWFKEQFYPEGEDVYAQMNQEAAESPLGANGVMMLTHFEGSAAPYWNPMAKGMFFNLSLGSRRSDFSRAILEGISLEIAHNLSLLENLVGDISVVSVAGGLTSFDLFNRMQADAFAKTVIRYDNNEASSLGALMSAAVTLGIYKDYTEAFHTISPDEPRRYEPDAVNVEKYSTLFKRKDALYNALNREQIYELFRSPV